jgi:hypothetical protein
VAGHCYVYVVPDAGTMAFMAVAQRRTTSGATFMVVVLLCLAGLVLTLYASLGLPQNRHHHSFSAARGWLQFGLAAAVPALAALGAARAWQAARRQDSSRSAITALLAALLAFGGWLLAFFG